MAKHVAAYIRVSTTEQNEQLQLDAVQSWAKANNVAPRFYRDKFTGRTMNRPGWNRLEKEYRAGRVSTLIVWKFDRFGRMTAKLAGLIQELRNYGIRLVSLTEGFDIATPAGRMQANMMAAVAEYENSVRSERVKAGIAARHDRGEPFGRAAWKRSPYFIDVAEVRRLKAEGVTMVDIAKQLGVSRAGCYKALKER